MKMDQRLKKKVQRAKTKAVRIWEKLTQRKNRAKNNWSKRLYKKLKEESHSTMACVMISHTSTGRGFAVAVK